MEHGRLLHAGRRPCSKGLYMKKVGQSKGDFDNFRMSLKNKVFLIKIFFD